MRSTNAPFKIPQKLWEMREELRKATGAKSVNAMLVGMYRYAMLHGREHTLTNAIAELSEEAQDEADDGLCELFAAGRTKNGEYMEHAMDRSVEKYAKGQNVPKDEVASNMIDQLRKIGQKGRSHSKT